MAKIKKLGSADSDQNLKRKDSKKNHSEGTSGVLLGTPFGSNKKLPDSMVDNEISNVKVKKKFPIVVDVIAGVLMLLIVIGVVVGSYLLFRFYSNDYSNRQVTYSLVINSIEDFEKYKALEKKDIYFDTSNNSLYFGRIESVELLEGKTAQILIKVSATVKYRQGEGCSIGDMRLAVGSEFAKLRCGDKLLGNAAVVKLALNGGK